MTAEEELEAILHAERSVNDAFAEADARRARRETLWTRGFGVVVLAAVVIWCVVGTLWATGAI